MKRKAAALFLALTMAVVSIAGCGSREEAKKGQKEVIQEEQETAEKAKSESEENSEPVDMNITALKGPTAMGMVQFMDQAEQGALTDENYHFSISASADEVTPKLVQGKTDVAAVPANLASVLYNKTNGQVQVLAVNTLGVLYLVENGNSVQSAADLKGKTIYASGKGSTPEYALDYILRQNNIDPEKDVTIEWKSEHSECVAAILTGKQYCHVAAAFCYHSSDKKSIYSYSSGFDRGVGKGTGKGREKKQYDYRCSGSSYRFCKGKS